MYLNYTQANYSTQKRIFDKTGVKSRMTFMDWSWSLLFAAALLDVVFSYFGNALHLPILPQPWLPITAIFFVVLVFSLPNIKVIYGWPLLAFSGLAMSILLGFFAIKVPTTIVASMNVPFSILPSDTLKMTVAFLIGMLWITRPNIDAKFITDLFLVVTAFHSAVCIIALLKLYPSAFPIIDSPYFKDGKRISRPEITTDQTRQVLYLFMCLTVVFIQRSIIKKIFAVFISMAIVYILAKVQSRSGALIFAFSFIFAFFLAVRYKKSSVALLFLGACLAVFVVIAKWNEILEMLGDLIWRFQQVDSSYGGRGLSNLYLLEKLIDPNYWVPMGYNDFFRQYGQAPHSFLTMVYLNAGLLGLVCYMALAFIPLIKLSKKTLKGKASEIEQIALFCCLFAVVFSITQPVIHHQIFWLFFGLSNGSLSRKYNNQALNTARQA